MVKQRKAQQESLSKLSDLIQEDLSGISAIKIYAQENAEKKEFNIYNNAYRNSAIKLARTASTLFPLLQGISSVSLLILLSLGTFQLESGFISIVRPRDFASVVFPQPTGPTIAISSPG